MRTFIDIWMFEFLCENINLCCMSLKQQVQNTKTETRLRTPSLSVMES